MIEQRLRITCDDPHCDESCQIWVEGFTNTRLDTYDLLSIRLSDIQDKLPTDWRYTGVHTYCPKHVTDEE